MKKLIMISVVVAASLLQSCQKDGVEAENSVNQNSLLRVKEKKVKNLPFKGSHSTSSEILQPAPFLKTRITGTGYATFLGKNTFVAISTIDFTTQPPFHLSGTATFTSANNDEIYTSFAGTSTPNGQGAFTIVMSHTITGGTGRFQNATGSFMGYTTAVPGHTAASIDYEGTISF
jgi:hypothetical protein